MDGRSVDQSRLATIASEIELLDWCHFLFGQAFLLNVRIMGKL